MLRWCQSQTTSKYKNNTTSIQHSVTEADPEMPKKIHDKSSKSLHATNEKEGWLIERSLYLNILLIL